MNYVFTFSVAASLVFTVSALRFRCASGETCCITVNLQCCVLIVGKKRSGFRGDVLASKPNSYWVCAESEGATIIKAPKHEMGPISTRTSSWTLLVCLYLHDLLTYLQELVM